MFKEWKFKEGFENEKSVIKRLLFSRGIKTDKEIYDFLHPLETNILSGNVFCDMPKAVERLSKAIDNSEKILIYGDFDADGVTATSLLYKTLQHLGADVNYFIPDRDKDGHGFNTRALVQIQTKVRPKVIISVDCGISNVEELAKLSTVLNKPDVIITDHHEAPEILPDVYAIINPKAPNALDEKLSLKEIESMTSLAGVGVAFKVAHELLKHYNKTEFVSEILPFVAIGTVADIVPLIGENRYYVVKGLDLISQGRHYGIKRLLESASYNLEKGITAENIAFGIAPRINASGRLETVANAVKVLTSDNNAEIETAIQSLNELNKVRQTLCQDTFLEADAMLQKEGNKNPAVILCNPEWHVGIIGIVASKFVEKYYKPTFLMTYSEETQQYRCSARGIEGLSLYEIIAENAELFNGFGGHTLAAGLGFTKETATFEQVKNALNKTILEQLQGKELKPFVEIDLELQPDDITIDFINALSTLEPFGASNPPPAFVLRNLKVKQKRLMGENNEHLKITAQVGNSEFSCIRWGQGDIALANGDTFDVAFHPQINDYKGNLYIQLIVDDIHSEVLKEEEKEETGLKIYDHRKKTDILNLVEDYVKHSDKNIRIFAESKVIQDSLKPFKSLYERIFTRENLENCEAVMFFDYPSDKESLNAIIEQTNPSAVHLMKYDIKCFDDKSFLTTFVKMLRYADNNGGDVNILRCASALGKSFEVIYSILDLFEELSFIQVEERNESFYKIKLNDNIDISLVLHNPKYAEIATLIKECENFQTNLLQNDIADLELV